MQPFSGNEHLVEKALRGIINTIVIEFIGGSLNLVKIRYMRTTNNIHTDPNRVPQQLPPSPSPTKTSSSQTLNKTTHDHHHRGTSFTCPPLDSCRSQNLIQ
ncbi:hypothetical protein CR513_57202, partial [Mucuna pruriens]